MYLISCYKKRIMLYCFVRFGRYNLFVALISCGALAVASTGLSNSYVMFITIRALIGATLFSANIVGFTLSK